jgi:hypothetical protein
MKLSRLIVATLLLFPSLLLAQHASGSGPTPSSPPPPPPSTSSPSTSSPSTSSAASSPHISPPSTPSPGPSPSAGSSAASMSSHPSPSPTQPASHVPNSVPAPTPGAGSMTSRLPVNPPEREPGHVIPERKQPGDEGKIIPRAPSVNPPQSEAESARTDMRRRICDNGPCKEVPPQPTSADPDLRRRICKDGPCVECPPGQSAGKDGKCVTAGPPSTNTISNQCQPDETWNGAACVPITPAQCKAGEFWDGLRCADLAQVCTPFNGRAALLQNEIRGIKGEMEQACRNNPSGQRCMELKQSYDGAILRYRMLMNEAPVACRTMLLDPLAI